MAIIMQKTLLATLNFWKIFTQHPELMYLHVTGGEARIYRCQVRGQGQKPGPNN